MNNYADYFTKHHPTKYYLYVKNNLKFVCDSEPQNSKI